MARDFVLVDAHNVIFARSDLAALHRRTPSAARQQLIQILERYQDSSGHRVVVVFDGGATPRITNELSRAAGVQIFYPRAGQSADAIIEQLVTKYASIHNLTVVTADNLIRAAASAAGAATMDPDALFDVMARAENELNSTLDKLRRRR